MSQRLLQQAMTILQKFYEKKRIQSEYQDESDQVEEDNRKMADVVKGANKGDPSKKQPQQKEKPYKPNFQASETILTFLSSIEGDFAKQISETQMSEAEAERELKTLVSDSKVQVAELGAENTHLEKSVQKLQGLRLQHEGDLKEQYFY